MSLSEMQEKQQGDGQKKNKFEFSRLVDKVHDSYRSVLWVDLKRPLTEAHVQSLLEEEEHRINQLDRMILNKIDRLEEHLNSRAGFWNAFKRTLSKPEANPDLPQDTADFYSYLVDDLVFAQGLTADHFAEYIARLTALFQKFPKEREVFGVYARRGFTFKDKKGGWYFSQSWTPEAIDAFLSLLNLTTDQINFRNWGKMAPVPLSGITEVARQLESQTHNGRERLKLWVESMNNRILHGHVALEVVVPNLKAFKESGKLPPEAVGPFGPVIGAGLESTIKSLKRDLNQENLEETLELLKEIHNLADNAKVSVTFTEPALPVERQRVVLDTYFENFVEKTGLTPENPGRTEVERRQLGDLTATGRRVESPVRGIEQHSGLHKFVFGLKSMAELIGQFDPELITKLCRNALFLIYELPDNYFGPGLFEKVPEEEKSYAAFYGQSVEGAPDEWKYEWIALGLEEEVKKLLDIDINLEIPQSKT